MIVLIDNKSMANEDYLNNTLFLKIYVENNLPLMINSAFLFRTRYNEALRPK